MSKNKSKKKTPNSPGIKLHASQTESSPKEKKPDLSLANVLEVSPNAHRHSPPGNQRHHNLNRALLLKVPRQNNSVQHSQKKHGKHSAVSTSHGKTNNSESRSANGNTGKSQRTERKEKASQRTERIRSNTFVIDFIPSDARKLACALCTGSASDASVVAVLVCGHIYHAECLEATTPYEDRRDPPCPFCISSDTVN